MDHILDNKSEEIMGSNYVEVGGFEHCPENLNKEPYFCLRVQGSHNLYFGTSAQIREVDAEMDDILDPVVEVSNSGYMVRYPRWVYMDASGQYVEAQAEMMDIHEVLFEVGNRYIRAARCCFEGLQSRHPREDWVPFSPGRHPQSLCLLGSMVRFLCCMWLRTSTLACALPSTPCRRRITLTFEGLAVSFLQSEEEPE